MGENYSPTNYNLVVTLCDEILAFPVDWPPLIEQNGLCPEKVSMFQTSCETLKENERINDRHKKKTTPAERCYVIGKVRRRYEQQKIEVNAI